MMQKIISSLFSRPSSFTPCLLSLISCLLSHISFSQTTYSSSVKKSDTISVEKKDTRKVLVIPFEPKLYMSEIDQHVNKESKMNFNQIRHAFRSGLEFNVVAEFRKKYKVVSLMMDTSKSMSDQRYIYSSIGYKYEVVPNPDEKKSEGHATKPVVQNGQLMVTTNDQKKYMNTKITNPALLATLHKKYGTELFVFINQLDLKNDIDNSGKAAAGNYERIAGVHYSIFDLSGKLLNSGLATSNFPASTNDPDKIGNECFSKISQTILDNYISATTPKVEKSKGILQWQDAK